MKTEEMKEYFYKKGFHLHLNTGYAGWYYTVVEAKLTNGKAPNKTLLFSEGIARRSHTQATDNAIGESVATHRAVEALYKKFHRKHKVVHSFMMA